MYLGVTPLKIRSKRGVVFMPQLPLAIDRGLLPEEGALFPGTSGLGRRAKQTQWPEKFSEKEVQVMAKENQASMY